MQSNHPYAFTSFRLKVIFLLMEYIQQIQHNYLMENDILLFHEENNLIISLLNLKDGQLNGLLQMILLKLNLLINELYLLI